MLAAFAKITNQLKQHEHEHVREHMYERAYARNTHNYEFSFMNFCVIYIFNYIFVAAVVVVVAVAVAVLYVLLYNKRESVCTLSSQIEYAEREQPQCTVHSSKLYASLSPSFLTVCIFNKIHVSFLVF